MPEVDGGPRSSSTKEQAGGWQHVRPRNISQETWQRFQVNIAEIFEALGLQPGTPGTERTAERYLRAMFDVTEGYEGDTNLVTAFPTECRGGPDCRISQVIEGPIPFHALCEHHALPFFGEAYVGYIAHENIIGISKMTRIVRVFAQRFTVQERIGQQVADLLVEVMSPHGVAVYLNATHLCTQMRGVREHQSKTWTTFWRGNYEQDPQLRSEFLSMCRSSG
ncbi:MAG: GTP cyclohydrolase I [Candidatus Dormibacteria bacterium]